MQLLANTKLMPTRNIKWDQMVEEEEQKAQRENDMRSKKTCNMPIFRDSANAVYF